MVKLIALDMDGTLMSPDHTTVSEENKKALREAHDKGVKIAISTGRTLSLVGNVCEQVPEIDYILFSNGAGVYDRKADKIIYSNTMSWETAHDILKYLDDKPIFIEMYANGRSHVQKDKEKLFPFEIFPREFIESLFCGMTICESLEKELEGQNIEKFTTFIIDPAVFRDTWDYLSSLDNLLVTTSIDLSIEMTKKETHKGDALSGMCKVLGIDASECMAFGDANNDLSMLEFAGYSFAMGNASEECKKAAKYITKSNAESGVAFGIKQFI